jgi:hypothetical protein
MTGARRAQQYPLQVKVQQIRGPDRVEVFKKEDDRRGTVAGPESQNRFRRVLAHDVFRQYDDVRVIGFRGAQEVIFARTARDNAMTARVQKRLDPGACDLLPVGDHQRGDFAPPGPRRGRRTMDFRSHDFLPREFPRRRLGCG